jgi:hypothetical protein
VTTGSTCDLYATLVRRRAAPAVRDWFDRELARLGEPRALHTFATVYAVAGRRLGAQPIEVDPAEESELRAGGLPIPRGRPLSEIGRTALLLRALQSVPPEEHAAFVDALYRHADGREQEALLRGLAVLPGPGRFVQTAIEACRSNVRTVFEAIACSNPYAARFFPDPSFAQMTLKALSLEVPLDRIVGLPERITADLRRMADDYSRERRAAGRPVPVDLALLTEPEWSKT